jgi:intein-encoded DNA endonuclease-like protein
MQKHADRTYNMQQVVKIHASGLLRFDTKRECPVYHGMCYKAQLVRKFFGQQWVITCTARNRYTTQNTSINTTDMSRGQANKFFLHMTRQFMLNTLMDMDLGLPTTQCM